MERLLMTFLFILCSLHLGFAQGDPYVAGEVLVRYAASTSVVAKAATIGLLGAKATPLEGATLVPNVELLVLSQGMSVPEAIGYLEKLPNVLYASPNYIIRIDGGIFPPRDLPGNPGGGEGKFKDPLFYRSYGVRLIGAEKSWDSFTIGSSEVIVGVIDTGIDYTHEDLASNVWKNPKEIPNNGIDDDNNGFIDDIYGWNFVNNTNNPIDDNRHGTHVSGTIGAVAGNNLGTIGVSPKISMMACKFLDNEGQGTTKAAIDAISYAVSNGAKILNNSWGGHGFSPLLLDTIKAAERMGVLVVAAAGNWNENNDERPVYPASFDAANVISVAATDQRDRKADFSNYGKNTVDLGAPGVVIYSTLPLNRYGNSDGTSMAAPHVSGAAALILAYKPHLSAYDLKNVILNSVDPLNSLRGVTVTEGRMNVYNAMALGFLSF